MSLKKCKECGNKVSTRAKFCPHCGAKVPNKISGILLCLLFFLIFISYIGKKESNKATSTKTNINKTIKKRHEVKTSQKGWYVFKSKNEMTGKVSAYATSPDTFPNRKMAFPYQDVKSWLAVGCDGRDEWVYFGFNTAPNITNDETRDGYNLIKTRVKWDNTVQSTDLIQKWGAKFIHFKSNQRAVSNIMRYSNLLLELEWYGEQSIYFEYSLEGSATALEEMRRLCKDN